MNSKLAAYGGVDHMQQMVERRAPLVKRIAYHLLARLPASVQADDLIQAGMIGLIEAARNFDGSKGASFETFAGIRIRGAMLDDIRRGDWTPRSVHRNARLIADTIAELEAQLGRDVRDYEVAEKEDYFMLSSNEGHVNYKNDVKDDVLINFNLINQQKNNLYV